MAKKIMFNDQYGLTQAVLDGRKTQTRRIIQDEFFTLNWDVRNNTLVVENDFGDFIDIKNTKFCMFKIGEIVAVAQSYKDSNIDFIQPNLGSSRNHIWGHTCNMNGYNNKMFVQAEVMPHQIRITNVRIQRFQEISDEDCLKEGVELNTRQYEHDGTKYYCVRGLGHWRGIGCYNFNSPREAYAALIGKIFGKATWDRNPYVFIYDFNLVK